MSKITNFTPATLENIRKDFTAAMAALEAKYGVKVNMGKITYSEKEFTAKLTSVIIDESSSSIANVDPKWVSDFHRSYYAYGLTKEDLNTEISIRGTKATIVGSRSRANLPIVVKFANRDGFTAIGHEEVRKALGR